MTTRRQWWNWVLPVAALALILPVSIRAVAQTAEVPQDSADAGQDPSGRVARLNYVEGSVSFQPGGESDWVDAVLNRPLVTGDNLWSDESSRAEIHIGSTALRLGPKTGITLLEVSDRAAQIRLAQGSLVVRVRHVDDEDSYEIDTPNIAFAILQEGEYRLEVDPEGTRTQVTVFHGRGEATGGGYSYTVVAGQHAAFTGTDRLNYDLGQIPNNDALDSWAFARDNQEDDADSANYVSREMTGYEDLDPYGTWSYVAGYGMSWHPIGIGAGWAPYRFGRWAWVGPWGWTWVEDEPWGFAPFHYGRWAFAGTGWFWVPGPSLVRPVYAPALVGWVGASPKFNFSFGAGVGWFPLAPGEVFVPGYRVSRTYVNKVNFTNTRVDLTKVTTAYNAVSLNRGSAANNLTYANLNITNGVTVVSRDTFVQARPVARNIQNIGAKEIQAAPVSSMAFAEPVRGSVLGAGRQMARRPPAAVINRQVVALRNPAAMPYSFDQSRMQAGGLNQQSLVRQQPAGQPVPPPQVSRPAQAQQSPSPKDEAFRAFGQSGSAAGVTQTSPRVWEAQGTPEPERNNVGHPEGQSGPARQWSHPLAKPVAPARPGNQAQQRDQEQKFSNWQHQRPAPAPTKQQDNAHAPAHSAPAPPK
jgi:hypothetical protein